MRDPKRITRILGKLGQLWRSAPDYRLGQMVVNLTADARRWGETNAAVFYIEDADLEKALDHVLAGGTYPDRPELKKKPA